MLSNPTTANEETGETHQDLFQPSQRLAGEITEQRRNKSAELLKRELLKQGRYASREYLAKVNLAIAVLYARHVLTGLLAHWPSDGPLINAALLGCKELHQIPCVLDLLFKADNKDFFKKVDTGLFTCSFCIESAVLTTYVICRVSVHGCCHVCPWLIEFSDVVFRCFTLSWWSVFMEVSPIEIEDLPQLLLSTYCTMERGPHSSWLCSCCLQNEAFVL